MKRESTDREKAAEQLTVPAAKVHVQPAAERGGLLVLNAADRVRLLAGAAAAKVLPSAHAAADRFNGAAVRGASYTQSGADRIGSQAQGRRRRASGERVSGGLLPQLSEVLSVAAATPLVVKATKRGNAIMAAAKGELSPPEPKRLRKRDQLRGLVLTAAVAGVGVGVVKKLFGAPNANQPAASSTVSNAATQTADAAGGEVAMATANKLESATDLAQPTPSDAPVADESTDVGSVGANLGHLAPPSTSIPTERLSDTPEPALQAAVGDGGFHVEEGLLDIRSDALEAPVNNPPSVTKARLVGDTKPGNAATKYSGEGIYVGSEPPEGFVIKGNERSMKYHTPKSGGYTNTTAEVWFNSEQAAQQAGFIRAQG